MRLFPKGRTFRDPFAFRSALVIARAFNRRGQLWHHLLKQEPFVVKQVTGIRVRSPGTTPDRMRGKPRSFRPVRADPRR